MTKTLALPEISDNIIEGDSKDLSVIDKPKKYRLLRVVGPVGIYLLCCLAILPFFFGGRGDFANAVIKGGFYLLAICSITYYLIFLPARRGVKEKVSYKTALLFLPFLSYLLVQCVPLPLSLLEVIAPNSARAYQMTLSTAGYLSVDPGESFKALSWFIVFTLMLSFLVKMPFETEVIKGRASNRRKKTVNLAPISREYDYFSERLQVFLVGVSLFCAFIGLTHLALRSEALFGLFSFNANFIPTSRAHWPFVNANQLAIMIEVGLMTAFARFLRERNLRKLTLTSSSDEGLMKTLVSALSQLERQAKSLIVIGVLSLTLLLTMSRAGILISFLGLSSMWLMYRLNPVYFVPSKREHRQSRKPRLRWSFWLSNALLPFAIFLVLLSVLGGEALSGLSGRVTETYKEGGSLARSELNELSKSVLRENLLFGVGLNNWQLVAPSFVKESLAGWKIDYAHNDYLQLISEIGLVGLALIFIPFVYAVNYLKFLLGIGINPVQKVFLGCLGIGLGVPLIHASVDFPFHLPLLSLAIFSLGLALIRGVLFLERQSK